MRRQWEYKFQTSEQDKTQRKELIRTKINNIVDKEFKVMVMNKDAHQTWEQNG